MATPLRDRTFARRHSRRRSRHRREEGAALLVIMIIIVITTAAAAISVQNTTVEVHTAGRERILIQTRYASEAAMQTTIAYLDTVSDSFLSLWQQWNADDSQPPEMRGFTGGHQITNLNRHHAARSMQQAQAMLAGARLIEPVTGPDLTLPIPDYTGSFGPGQPYSMEPYIVDITDCFEKGSVDEGDAVNGPYKSLRFFCTLTVRGRVSMNAESGQFVSWDLPGGFNGVLQERSGAAHDLRVTIETPEMFVPRADTQ